MRAGEGGGYRAPDSTALAEDQDQETAEGHSQAPDPPLPPRDEPLAQTGPERFVQLMSMRSQPQREGLVVGQGWKEGSLDGSKELPNFS
ncbi:hypothetical protein MJG53_002663 [Ovis ammon polii x Ovis aries]|uniref:Uncharacterized protein n=3 Tax=Ovis TaxID=9935 RepID=A0A836D681_SHEEP|nr:hypothetical protein JEQ12_009859 [Ovis aries]KAI4544458.1 hypothetical protein MG293_004724 [Ovis ammon polii]KAI4574718.1 hypothetical protein MJT46_003997 [Ovis ammon polii x Ovis aries]KAI4588255.1 hypothetical protein MJG53_002663 [Ovis ammon polii x Ovis aries]